MVLIAHHIKRKVCKKIFISDFIHGGRSPLDVREQELALQQSKRNQ